MQKLPDYRDHSTKSYVRSQNMYGGTYVIQLVCQKLIKIKIITLKNKHTSLQNCHSYDLRESEFHSESHISSFSEVLKN